MNLGMNKNVKGSQKTAIKLINKYAEEYQILDTQLKFYKEENADLKTNILVHKEIIKNFFLKQPIEEKMMRIFEKQNEEIELLTNQINNFSKMITKERECFFSFKEKMQIHYSLLKQKYEKLFQENFLLTNLLQEKNAILSKFRKNNKKNSTNPGVEIKETYVTNPSILINTINNELFFYKERNESLSNEIMELKKEIDAINRKNKQLELFLSKSNLNQRLNSLKYNNYNTISSFQDVNCQSNQLKKLNEDSKNNINANSKKNKIRNFKSENNLIIRQLESFEEINKIKSEIIDSKKEWSDILKNCNVSPSEYLSFSQNPSMKKLCDIIEFLFKNVIEKNRQLSLVFKENESLNVNNIKINKRNIELTSKLGEICFRKGNQCHYSSTNVSTAPTYNNDSVVTGNKNYYLVNGDKLNNTLDSVTSSDFNNGILFDLFDLESEMSKRKKKGYNIYKDDISPVNDNSIHIKI